MPTKDEYSQLVKANSPNSPLWKNMVAAFIAGGIICALGQGLYNLFENVAKLPKDEASVWTSVSLIFLGALLTALGLYNRLAAHAGAGTLIPITGFANSVASPAIEFKSEGIISGMCCKMFVIAGPIIVVATVGSVLYGLVLLFI